VAREYYQTYFSPTIVSLDEYDTQGNNLGAVWDPTVHVQWLNPHVAQGANSFLVVRRGHGGTWDGDFSWFSGASPDASVPSVVPDDGLQTAPLVAAVGDWFVLLWQDGSALHALTVASDATFGQSFVVTEGPVEGRFDIACGVASCLVVYGQPVGDDVRAHARLLTFPSLVVDAGVSDAAGDASSPPDGQSSAEAGPDASDEADGPTEGGSSFTPSSPDDDGCAVRGGEGRVQLQLLIVAALALLRRAKRVTGVHGGAPTHKGRPAW
jgi:hypothetical protein